MLTKKGEWSKANERISMKKLFLAVIFLAASAMALSLAQLENTMQTNINKARAALKAHGTDIAAAANEMYVMFDPIFDYEFMAKLSLSKRYNTLTPAQKDEFNKAFEAQLKNSFTSKLGLYKDYEIIVSGREMPKKDRLFLNSQMVIDGEPRKIIFKFYDKKGDWRIYDVDILGVSIIQTYRSQFSDMLENADFDALIKKLNEVKFEKK